MGENPGATRAESPPPAGRMLRAISEGKRFEAYAEQQTGEMHVCGLCERVYYRRKPMKRIGATWVCIDCLRELKEALESLDRWEEMSVLHDQIEQNVPGTPKP